jgi:hypothetical protein
MMAKAVHPDLNPNMPNANEMMAEVNKFKNSPEMLLHLARKWGLQEDGTFNENIFNKRSNETKEEHVYRVVVGSVIRFWYHKRRRRHCLRGVVIEIRPIKRGRYAGAKEYKVYSFTDGSIMKYKTHSEPPFTVVGKADTDQVMVGKEAEERIKETKKRKSDLRQERANDHFNKLGLVKPFDYSRSGVKVLVNYKSGPQWKDLAKTTSKSAYVYEIYRTRRIPIWHVLDVRRRDHGSN